MMMNNDRRVICRCEWCLCVNVVKSACNHMANTQNVSAVSWHSTESSNRSKFSSTAAFRVRGCRFTSMFGDISEGWAHTQHTINKSCLFCRLLTNLFLSFDLGLAASCVSSSTHSCSHTVRCDVCVTAITYMPLQLPLWYAFNLDMQYQHVDDTPGSLQHVSNSFNVLFSPSSFHFLFLPFWVHLCRTHVCKCCRCEFQLKKYTEPRQHAVDSATATKQEIFETTEAMQSNRKQQKRRYSNRPRTDIISEHMVVQATKPQPTTANFCHRSSAAASPFLLTRTRLKKRRFAYIWKKRR